MTLRSRPELDGEREVASEVWALILPAPPTDKSADGLLRDDVLGNWAESQKPPVLPQDRE